MNSYKKKRIAESKQPEKIKDLNWDVIKWLVPIVISWIGLFLWMAGTAYEAGFWHFLGISDPPFSITFQRTVLNGLIGPISIWTYALLGIAGYGLAIFTVAFFMGWLKTKCKRRPKFISSLELFSKNIISQNKETFNFSLILIAFGMIGVLILLPLSGAVFFAHKEGIASATRGICAAKNEKKFKSTIYLSNGKKVMGNFWQRTEKFDILVNERAIMVISVGDKQQILDSTKIDHIDCKT